MSVIINDFEIIPEPPPPQSESPQRPVTPDAVKLSPEDVIAIQKREQERTERVRAD